MLKNTIAALAGVFFCAAALAQDYTAVEDWIELPAGRETLGRMHGDVAVSNAGDVYVSVETEGMGVQVFSPDGVYLRSLSQAPADMHGFVIRETNDGEHLYGVSLRGQKFVKMTLAGDIVLEVSGDSIPRQYWVQSQYSDEPSLLLSGMDVRANGDIFVTDGYASDVIHRFSPEGQYLESFGGKSAPYEFNILHKIAIDTRFDPARIIATDRLNNRVVHLGLDGRFIGVVNDELLLPAALVIDGDHVVVGELQGRVSVLDIEGNIVAHFGTNEEEGIGSNTMPPEDWRTGYVVAPHGVDVDADGNLYVSEFSNYGRVHKFARD